MYAAERQQHILERARSEGRVEVAGLAAELDVTAETVRRDLTLLERHGLVRRVHGGAVPVERLGFEPAVAAREDRLVAEKERIAKAAVAELPDDGAIILDAGTTTAKLAEQLPFDRELRVVTNSLTIANLVASRPGRRTAYLGLLVPLVLGLGAIVAAAMTELKKLLKGFVIAVFYTSCQLPIIQIGSMCRGKAQKYKLDGKDGHHEASAAFIHSSASGPFARQGTSSGRKGRRYGRGRWCESLRS
jgi:DNA-binding Lrp family transcriptional regulator